MEELKKHILSFFPFAQKRMGFDRPPKLFLKQDNENAKNTLGKTAFYDPAGMSITLFTTGRHPKDVLRSLSHELVHHTQNCRGDFEGGSASEDGYAQTDPHLREMEREAYEQGNLCFRDWEDSIKYGGEQTMNLNESKLREAIRAALRKVMKEGTLVDDESTEAEAAEGEQKGTEEYPEGAKTNEGAKYNRDDEDKTGGNRYGGGGHLDYGEEDEELEEAVKWGGNKGDKSKTHKGEKDYTTKKGEEKKTTNPGRGEKKGDEAYVNEEEELDEGGRANRRENEEQGEERRMKTSSAMRENKNKMPIKEWYQHSLFDRLTERFTRD
jgi:hypothetical protein